MARRGHRRAERGFSYLEVMVASVILALAAVPALDAMSGAGQRHAAQGDALTTHLTHVAILEQVLAEPYTDLLAAAAVAGNRTTATTYSSGQVEVFIARWDGDGNPFNVADANLDRDGDPFTGYAGMLWVRVAAKATAGGLESVTTP